MKISEIVRLVETYSKDQLIEAEESIVNNDTPAIRIEGIDEGEKLTHAFAAIYVIDKVNELGIDTRAAIRLYTKMVRETMN